ncbi:MAG: hypothetical protein AAFR76_04975 [Planctomycetota bacterium]
MPDADQIKAYLADRDVPCPRCGYNLRGVADPTCPECAGEISFRPDAIRCEGMSENDRNDVLVPVLIGLAFALCGTLCAALIASWSGSPAWALVLFFAALGIVALAALARRKTGWFLRQPPAWQVFFGLLAWIWLIGPVVAGFVYVTSSLFFGWP